MTKYIFTAAALAMAFGLFASSAKPVYAVSAPYAGLQNGVAYNYEYTLSDPSGMRLDRNGAMQLTFSADNIISGHYDPNDFLSFIPVTGGRKGTDFWIDIGSRTMHLLHVTGTIQPDGSLSGYAFRGNASHEFLFKAVLKK